VTIVDKLASVRERIHAAARRANRNPDDISLMAVSKTFAAGNIIDVYFAGQHIFGESRVQEFEDKVEELSSLTGARFHMIGHLQSNKAAKAAEIFHAVDSVDSAKLAQRLNDAAQKLGKTLDVLIEINVGGEDAKSGLAPDSPELADILGQAPQWRNLLIRGLMTVPPYTEDPEGARPYFRKLRELRDGLAAQNSPGVTLDTLSMGMSHDFEVAIEEGSTCVRVGTAIFGERPKPIRLLP
jgi:pyridoxal phosphate enzyme (YggS family)